MIIGRLILFYFIFWEEEKKFSFGAWCPLLKVIQIYNVLSHIKNKNKKSITQFKSESKENIW